MQSALCRAAAAMDRVAGAKSARRDPVLRTHRHEAAIGSDLGSVLPSP
ncbi:hypothetical protein LC55x_2958 [Lysobacter capsici]|nr:hypothetical protein LC55x_2958 [Lysobacter capsici]